MKPHQRDQLAVAMLQARAMPKCMLCGDKTAAVGMFTRPLPNGQQRFYIYPACAKCVTESADPEIGPATCEAIERRLAAVAQKS